MIIIKQDWDSDKGKDYKEVSWVRNAPKAKVAHKLPPSKNTYGFPMAENVYGPPMAQNIYGPPMAQNTFSSHYPQSD